MNGLEDQIGENDATRIAPWNWAELQRECTRRQRRINLRELCELLAVAIGAAVLCGWVL